MIVIADMTIEGVHQHSKYDLSGNHIIAKTFIDVPPGGKVLFGWTQDTYDEVERNPGIQKAIEQCILNTVHTSFKATKENLERRLQGLKDQIVLAETDLNTTKIKMAYELVPFVDPINIYDGLPQTPVFMAIKPPKPSIFAKWFKTVKNAFWLLFGEVLDA